MQPAIQRIYQTLGAKVAKRRKEIGMIQDDLAAILGLSRPSVTNIEVGRQRILIHQVFDIADALDMDVSELLGLEATWRRDVMEIDPAMWPGLFGKSKEPARD